VLRRLLLILLVLLLLGLGFLLRRLNDHPSLEPYAALTLVSDPAAQGPGVQVTFLGVSTVLVSDGTTALLSDGFFTRPGKASVFLGRVAPDPELIARSLERAGIQELAAVFAAHSHYDHALDSPEVARRTGALLLGSESTANIARGVGFPEERIRVVKPGESLRFGGFTLTAIASKHFPHGMAMGEITAPLVPPARATDYREGGSYSLLFEHELGSLLVHASAGWQEGALAGRRADVVLLGVGGLGTRDDAYREQYFREVVDAVSPRCVIPIHWDDFTRPLDAPLEASPSLLDDVPGSLAFLARKTKDSGRGLGLLPVWRPVRLLGAGAAPCGVRS
jgi:L-ascorbate metabolism protein UlaG (beta-lactamase superfamily)